MQNWYNSIEANQKLFIFMLSTLSILVFGIGLIPIAVLVYLELGSNVQDRHIFEFLNKYRKQIISLLITIVVVFTLVVMFFELFLDNYF